MALSETQRRSWTTAAWLTAFFLVALFLRSWFSLDAGFDEGTQRYVFSGNDPYYEDRHLQHVVDTGRNLDFDPGINYPTGRGNPNPPLWIWMTAPFAAVIEHNTSFADPSGLTINWSGAIFGALIVFPVFMLGRDLFGRRAGLWAAMFIALSAPHIQRTVFGFAKHDAPTIFFVTLAMAFMARALRTLAERDYVADWHRPASVGAGVRTAFTTNPGPMLWATMAGLCLSAAALMWKGYDYALGILGIALLVQMVSDHLRRRDSTAAWLVYVIPLAVVSFLPWLVYYRFFPGFMPTTVIPGLYVLAGSLVLGALLLPMRRMPAILVFPGLILAGILGMLVLLLVQPGVYNTITTGLGYFVQSKLYSTIAEAQRPLIGQVAANFAFFIFLLGLWGLARVILRAYKGQAAHVLMLAFSGISLFLTFRASRFLMNAAPIFAILAAAVTVTLLEKSGLLSGPRRYGQAQTGLRAIGQGKATAAALFVGLLVIVPAVVEGLDASTSFEYEAEKGLQSGWGSHFFGAFGISFDLKDNGWIDAMDFLAHRDTCADFSKSNCTPGTDGYLEEAKRPGFIAWWDYGHWAIAMGAHPTVADPFQDHFELAGRFLASESEEEGVAWLTLLLLDHDRDMNNGPFSPAVRAALAKGNHSSLPDQLEALPRRSYQASYDIYSKAITGEEGFTVYDEVSRATDRRVGYMAADARMFPTERNPGIIYAPLYLANKNPDDFARTVYTQEGTTLTVSDYYRDASGTVLRRAPGSTVYTDQTGRNWTYYGGYAFPPGVDPVLGNVDTTTGIPVYSGGRIDVTPRFQSTMFARAFPSYLPDEPSAQGLRHWRMVHEALTTVIDDSGRPIPLRQVVLLEYYTGVEVSGTVTDDAGAPLAGFEVTFRDGSGATHDAATTAADGSFQVTAPFAENGDLTLLVRQAGQEVFTDNRSDYQFSRERARSGPPMAGVQVRLERGLVDGTVFADDDGDGQRGANETALAGANVTLDGQRDTRAGVSGAYAFAGVAPGRHQLVAKVAGYNDATRTDTLTSAGQLTLDFAMRPKASPVNLTFREVNGTAVPGISIQLRGPTQTTVSTGPAGVVVANLLPGSYVASVNQTVAGEGGSSQSYTATAAFDVPFGGQPLDVVVTRDDA